MLIMDGGGWRGGEGGGGGGGRQRVSGSTARSDPERPRRLWTTARASMLGQWGPRHCVAASVLRNCCFIIFLLYKRFANLHVSGLVFVIRR